VVGRLILSLVAMGGHRALTMGIQSLQKNSNAKMKVQNLFNREIEETKIVKLFNTKPYEYKQMG
jgi:hypothetical protein